MIFLVLFPIQFLDRTYFLLRYHAVLQFKNKGSPEKPVGFYLFDLDSTHGTNQKTGTARKNEFNFCWKEVLVKDLFSNVGPWT